MSILNLSIRARLFLSFGVLVLLLAAATLTGIWGVGRMHAVAAQAVDVDVAMARSAARLQTEILELRRFEKDMLINLPDRGKLDSYGAKWDDALRSLNSSLDEVRKLADPESQTVLRALSDSVSAYADGFRGTVAQIRTGRLATTAQANEDVTRYKDAIHRTDEHIDALIRNAQVRVNSIDGVLAAKRTTVETTLSVLCLCAAGLAAWFAYVVTRSIRTQLEIAVRWSEQVAKGELGHAIRIEGRDELARLLKCLGETDEKLTAIVSQVRGAAESIGTAAHQISQGNDDLNRRTQEQAAALEETASSMEEMAATVKQNADNARQAKQLATGARTQADKGGDVVQRAVAAMNEIGDSSRKIADIIGVIDEIAFQTNLLALNAAVEAARAGEQGRGFAVVASEVRNLAQRSATAAREIKGLIQESVEKVGAGAALVNESGTTIGAIMESVRKVNDIVSEIAAASEEQATGVEQVNTSVAQIDTTTQQNAALVEEATAAIKSMEQQTRRLLAECAFFTVVSSTSPVEPVNAPVVLQEHSLAA